MRLRKMQGSKEKQARRIANTLSELRTQLSQQFAKSSSGVAGSADQRRATARRPGGYTIVELITAIAVGGFFLTSLSILVSNSLHLGQKVESVVLANAYVEGKVESLRNLGYSTLNDGTTDISGELPAELNSPKSASLEVSSPQDGLKQVEITVSYNDQGTTKTYGYTTYIGELGVGKQ